MGSYKMIAETLGMPRRTGAMPACMAELKEIVSELLARLQAAGEIAPELGMEYCYMSLLSAVVGGLMGLCYAADHDRDVYKRPLHSGPSPHAAPCVGGRNLEGGRLFAAARRRVQLHNLRAPAVTTP